MEKKKEREAIEILQRKHYLPRLPGASLWEQGGCRPREWCCHGDQKEIYKSGLFSQEHSDTFCWIKHHPLVEDVLFDVLTHKRFVVPVLQLVLTCLILLMLDFRRRESVHCAAREENSHSNLFSSLMVSSSVRETLFMDIVS